MRRSMNRFLTIWLLGTGPLSGLLSAQQAPSIELDPAIECWFHSEFPTLTALLAPPGEIVQSRLYFRCSTYPDYYFVDLAADGTAIAPRAEPSCPSVHYYVEALGRDFTSSRTEERVAEVTDTGECRRRYPAAAWFPGDQPRIILGSTVAGPAFAPGFSEVGVTGFISSTGVTSPVAGSGLSTGVVAGIAAGGAAAGAGVLAANAGGSSPDSTTTTTTPAVTGPPPPAPPPPGPSPSPTPSLKACFTLDPPNGHVETHESLTIDGRCSEGGDNLQFRYDLGDGRIKEGQAFVTAIWTQPGNYTLTLTVTRPDSFGLVQEQDSVSREIIVEPPPPPEEPPTTPVVAAFSARNLTPDVCHVEFDASASIGDIVSYVWELDTRNAFGDGVVSANGRVVQHNWGQNCYRAQGIGYAKLTVVGRDGQTDEVEQPFDAFNAFGLASHPSKIRRIETQVVVEVTGGDESASVLFRSPDGTTREIRLGASAVELRSAAGSQAVELAVTRKTPGSGPLHVKLDFTRTEGLTPGSLRVASGQTVAIDARTLVLRFEGGVGETARVELELAP